jgi:hypothetical protein
MKPKPGEIIFGFFLMAIVFNGSAALNERTAITWSQLPPVPDKLGVAAPFVGVSDGAQLEAWSQDIADPLDSGHR